MVAVNYNIIIIQFLLSVSIDVFILLFQRKTIENSIATIIILVPCTHIIPVFVLVMFEIRKKKINSFLDILASHKL